MYVYKFRLLFDDVDDFVRDYEICAKHSFKDFHNAIIASINGLSSEELASFHICDRKWNKRREITLVDMSTDMDEPEELMEEDENAPAIEPMITMENAVLSDYMDDPHQRIIYEHDFLNLRTFYIELLKSYEAKPNKKYPVCIFSSGELPQKNILITHDNELFAEENSTSTDENIDEDDDEVYFDENELDGFTSDFIDNPNF